MFGLGKKNKEEKQTPQEAPKAQSPEQPVVPDIPDTQFTVMPKQYLPKKSASKGIPSSVIYIGGGIFVVLVIIGIGYYFLFNQQPSQPVITQTQNTQVSQQTETIIPDESETAVVEDRVITAESYHTETNTLVGSLAMTIPSEVVEEVGESIGIVLLSEADLGMSGEESTRVVGGVYSVYPAARTFDVPVSFELIATNLPEGVVASDVYPARLLGSEWREIDDYQLSLGGYLFSFDKFPTGPIALVYTPEPEIVVSEEIEVQPIIATVDTDGDGLTDKEEQRIGTSSAAIDSDEDTYADLEEIENGYSPLAPNTRLEASGIFSTYTNPTYGYRVTYPTSWLADALDQTNKQVLFISETEEFFEILIEENPLNTPIVDWYRAQSPSLADVSLQVTILDGRPAVWSPDGLTLYTSYNGLVYILTYNKGALDAVNWPYFFTYFYKSFSFGVSATQQTESSNTATTTDESVNQEESS